MDKFIQTAISQTGLRYVSIENGSPFRGMGGVTGKMMSCIECGNHRPRRSGAFKRYLNALFSLL